MSSNNNNAFGKTICSICYEDLKPLIEDLQSISICGHVFHELCLQQWLEYCSDPKKCTCPVCKQKCTQQNVGRLYFQSIGDPSDSNLSQKPSGGLALLEEKDPVFLVREVNRLKGKLLGITESFQRQEQHLKELNQELCVCKEQVNKESALKIEALHQKACFQRALQAKSEELDKTQSECSKLQERNMALGKELAAINVSANLDLDEDQVLKYASFGHGTNSKDTVDVLRKSLVLRNKSYKELMEQCSLLGRGESRSLKKLEKSREKMKKLKARVKELELALENRDNEALRSLKAARRTSVEVADLNGDKSNIYKITKSSPVNQMEQSSEPVIKPALSGGLTNHSILFRKSGNIDFHKDIGLDSCKKNKNVVDVDLEKDSHFPMDEGSFESPQLLHKLPSVSLKPKPNHSSDAKALKSSSTLDMGVETFTNIQTNFYGSSASKVGTECGMDDIMNGFAKDDMVHIDSPKSAVEGSSSDEVMEISPFHIRKEVSSSVPTSHPGDKCFAGGLLGPDGASWHLGKWCKRTQAKASISSSATMQGSSVGTGDLIAVGADGRGGRVKILRTQNQLDVKGGSALPKRFKNGSKQSSQQGQGCMQIEHFFAKAGRS